MLKKLFFKASFLSAIASGLSVIATIVIARWFGPEAFTDYTIDLAYIGFLLLFLEIIPSNFAVFRVQDDPEWLHSVSAIQVATGGFLVVGIAALGFFGLLFKNFSVWMLIYIIASTGKRFLDIRLQSSGRLSEFLLNEVITALIRLCLIFIGLYAGYRYSDVLWGGLALGMVISQFVWWAKNTEDSAYLKSVFMRAAWINAWNIRKSYIPYYLTIFLKRIKDGLIPVTADLFFASKTALASFFLSYKGITFVMGQVRIIEAILLHRNALDAAENTITGNQKRYIAIAAQFLSIVGSVFLVIISGYSIDSLLLIIILSFVAWPISFLVFERAKAYSQYKSHIINKSIFASIAVFVIGLVSTNYLWSSAAYVFSINIFISELIGYFVFKKAMRVNSNDKKYC